LRGLNIEDKDLHILQSMPKLHEIGVSKSSVTGGALAKLATVKLSNYIEFEEGRNLSALLQGIKGNPHVCQLQLATYVTLSESDYQNIATETNLDTLGLDFAGTTDANLKTLSNLPNLRVISLLKCKLTKASIKTLVDMARDRELTVRIEDNDLSKALKDIKNPNLHIESQKYAEFDDLKRQFRGIPSFKDL
jgi:hypothetical protein